MNRNLIDIGLVNKNYREIIKYATFIAIIALVNQLIVYMQSMIHINVQNELTYTLSEKAFNHMIRLKSSYFETNNFFEVITTVNLSIGQIAETANQQFLYVVVQMVKLGGGCMGLLLLNQYLALLVFLFVAARYASVQKVTGKRKSIFAEDLKLSQEFSFWYSDTMSGLKVVKLWGLYKKKQSEFEKIQKKLINCEGRISKVYMIEDLISSQSDNLLNVLIYLLGGLLLIYNKITLGELFTFLAYSQFTIQPVYSLVNFRYQLMQLEPRLTNYEFFMHLSEEENVNAIEQLPNRITSFVFQDLSWCFENRKILDNINIEIASGEKVAIIGHNGCGKSTLIDLLLRIKEPSSGKIIMNGMCIEQFPLEAYREMFAVIEQDGFLFDTTIRENIFFDQDHSINKKSQWMLEQLSHLKEGLNTRTGDRASLLSGGEKQKVLLMRALEKKKAQILILDEATANYDAESERMFNHFVKETNDYNIIIVITHRPDILRYMDKIILLEDGQISSYGSWDKMKGSIGKLLYRRRAK